MQRENFTIMGKRRQIETQVLSLKNRNQGRIMVFTGARQVGKTTLVRQLLDDYTYLSIEDPVSRSAYLRMSAQQWENSFPRAILDEVQKEPQLIESIKAAYDTFGNVRYVLLGSSQLLLLQKVRESLAGRCTIFEMYPLTLPEIATKSWNDKIRTSLWQNALQNPQKLEEIGPSLLLDERSAQKQAAWQHYLSFGGYPALVADDISDDERFLWLGNYVRTYLERDVRDLASFRDLDPFVRLQRATALYTGCVLNASNFARDMGVSTKTVQRYLEYLRLSYQVLLLPAWERNATKRLVKSPKIHYLDNGVLQAVLQKRGGITGQEFESLVVAEIYKQAKNILANASFYHLRTHDGREVDLLVETQYGYFAFEVKMTDHVSNTDARHLLNLGSMLDKPLLRGYVLSNDTETHQFADNIFGVNVAMFLG